MNPRHRGRWPLSACSAALLLLATVGCARTGSILNRGANRGSLRENLSRLEFQNRRLQEELKTAKGESNRLSSELQLSEIESESLSSKIDRYRSQLGARDPGDAVAGAYEPLRSGLGARDEGSNTLPASRGASRAPFTQIPNRVAIPAGPPGRPERSQSTYDTQPRPIIEPPPVRFFGPTGVTANPGIRYGGLAEDTRTWSPLARGGVSDDWEYR